ncbi:MAG: SdiA-regulated domain-containing protein [Bacteroidia bacterium]
MPLPSAFIFTIILPFVLSGCPGNQPGSTDTAVNTESAADSVGVARTPFPYDLNNPDRKTKLPDELVEVSGLGFMENGQICMVQDEEATIYIFDVAADSVTGVYPFGDAGDFEGIEMVEKNIFTLSTDGILTKVSQFETKIPKLEKFQTFLTGNYEPEGLTWLPGTNYLLIACKEEPDVKSPQEAKIRTIYYFDIDKKKMGEKPFATIDFGDISRAMDAEETTDQTQKWKAEFDPRKGGSFKPSGIAVHPLTGEIYITASVGKLLVVLDSALQVTHARYLSRDIFKQPEGICFDPAGNMFISNEGRDGKGNVLKFDYRAEK